MIKIGILGCAGKMGKALIKEVHFNDKTTLSGGIVRHDSEFLGSDLGVLAQIDPIGINASANIETLCECSDVIIDFTTPETSLECAKFAAKTNTAVICGTTGFTESQKAELKKLAKNNVIIWSANMSIGVNILLALTKQVSAILDSDYDIEILEMHHYQKVDSPSGTALILGEAAAEGRKVSLADVARKSREGILGERKRGEIGFATLRGGDVIGEHTVMFAGDGERIELTHKASSRKIFAKGAVRAAIWSTKQSSGLYNMSDVLTVNSNT